tara:strand:- start:1759 stop:2118 length:360 start_codon:yes stop_codon:yes gene_type:complete
MATRYTSIPAVPQGQLSGAATIVLISALKENVELLTAQRGESDFASKAIAIDQVKVDFLDAQNMQQVSSDGLGFTISGNKVANFDDYIELIQDVQTLANDLRETRDRLNLLIAQLQLKA